MTEQTISERLFIGMQHLLPQHPLSRLMRGLAHWEGGALSRLLIRGFLRLYDVNLAETERPDIASYRSFNDFFTRALRPGARPLDKAPDAVLCPVDGTVSQAGPLHAGALLQAKGLDYSSNVLLGGDAALAAEFDGGSFATIYLAPYNYHRIHMPLSGTLRRCIYVPGDLFSVNAATARGVPNLFARNERIACVFDTPAGAMAVVLVGALFVGSMSLAWAGEVTRRRPRRALELPVVDPIIALDRGAELGRFNMGSTVILLFPRDRVSLDATLAAGQATKMGERIATWR